MKQLLVSVLAGSTVVGAIAVWAWSQTMPATTQSSPATMTATAPSNTSGWNRGRSGGRDGENRFAQGLAATQPTTRSAAPAIPPEKFDERYAVIAEHNMFLRERTPRRPSNGSWTPRPNTETPAAPSPEQSLVLRGVVLEDELFRAFFENTSSNTMVRVAAGDPLARGRVAEIAVDAVLFESEHGPLWVDVGDNLLGAQVTPSGPTLGGTSTGSATAGGTSLTPGALQSVEERMRAARAARQGGGGPPAATGQPPSPGQQQPPQQPSQPQPMPGSTPPAGPDGRFPPGPPPNGSEQGSPPEPVFVPVPVPQEIPAEGAPAADNGRPPGEDNPDGPRFTPPAN